MIRDSLPLLWRPGMIGVNKINKKMYIVISIRLKSMSRLFSDDDVTIVGYPLDLYNALPKGSALDHNYILAGEALDAFLEHTGLGKTLYE